MTVQHRNSFPPLWAQSVSPVEQESSAEPRLLIRAGDRGGLSVLRGVKWGHRRTVFGSSSCSVWILRPEILCVACEAIGLVQCGVVKQLVHLGRRQLGPLSRSSGWGRLGLCRMTIGRVCRSRILRARPDRARGDKASAQQGRLGSSFDDGGRGHRKSRSENGNDGDGDRRGCVIDSSPGSFSARPCDRPIGSSRCLPKLPPTSGEHLATLTLPQKSERSSGVSTECGQDNYGVGIQNLNRAEPLRR